MGITDLFSKRQRRLRGEVPDVYKYNEIPQSLRVQIFHIIRETIDTVHAQGGIPAVFNDFNVPEDAYKYIHKTLCKEYGVFELTEDKNNDNPAVLNFLLYEKSIEKTLDVIELCFQVIDISIRNNRYCIYRDDLQVKFDDAISELNVRFKEHGVGFQFESHEIIRVDSEFLHTEAVKPTLLLLKGNDYKGANEEFLSAHKDYRHGRNKECLVELLKALESTMKTICQKRGWVTTPKDNASKLIKICFENNLLPAYLESEITSLRTLLESGVPTIRNKNGGHGQGTDIVTVPAYLARYALNLTASSILFLIEAEKEL